MVHGNPVVTGTTWGSHGDDVGGVHVTGCSTTTSINSSLMI